MLLMNKIFCDFFLKILVKKERYFLFASCLGNTQFSWKVKEITFFDKNVEDFSVNILSIKL